MTTDDPHAPGYLAEKTVRDELTRAFDICGGCRRCIDHCSVFPGLFDLLDGFDGAGAGAGELTPWEQDQLVDRCYHCHACAADCPYTPERHELALDLPRLMLRANAMRQASGQLPSGRRRTTTVLARTNLLTSSPLASLVARAPTGRTVRRVVERLTGLSAARVLPPRADRSFRSWFERRGRRTQAQRDRRVTVVPTCLVDRDAPQIGIDLVRVLEHNGVDCTVGAVACCGAPWLYAGDLPRFTTTVDENVRVLSAAVDDGRDVVVPQPICAHVLQRDHVAHAHPSLRSHAEVVARHTFDATDYLMRLHRTEACGLDTAFDGPVPTSITHQVGGHQRTRGIGDVGSDLLRLTGATVDVVRQDSADEMMWGLRAENTQTASAVARRLAARVERAAGEVTTGDSVLTNTTIAEQTGRRPLHPVEVIARAYGFAPEPPEPAP